MIAIESADNFMVDILSSALGFALAYGVKLLLSHRHGSHRRGKR